MANETVLFKRGDSATINSTPVTDGQILFDTSGNGKMYLDNGTDRLEMGGAITVDASLSKTSTNAIQNKAVTGNILNSLAEVSAATQQNTIAGALALKEVNSSLGGLQFGVDENGNYGYIKAGADSVTPFKSGVSTAGDMVQFTSETQTISADDCKIGDIYVCMGMTGRELMSVSNLVNCEVLKNEYCSNAGAGNYARSCAVIKCLNTNISFTIGNLSAYNYSYYMRLS